MNDESQELRDLMNLIEFGHWSGDRVEDSIPKVHGYSPKMADHCPVCYRIRAYKESL